MKQFLLAMLLGVLTQPVLAQRSTSGYTLGDVVTSFALTNVDNRTISLGEYTSQKGVIVVFTSNHCPFSKAYEDRILALDRKFGPQGYPVIAILSSDAALYEEDSFDRMQVRARTKNYTFPYLLDASQGVTKAFGATRTPQVYVLKRTGERFTVEYIGSVDDSPQDAAHVQRSYADEAVTSLLAGRPIVTPLTKAIGCAIKLK